MEIERIIQLLNSGKVGVMATDTIYGIVGSALVPQAVEEIYRLRKRSTNKPMIILISRVSDLKKFKIKLTSKQQDFLTKIWPNPVSVVLQTPPNEFKYLHRGTNSLAFRIPKKEKLLEILQKTGPLVAPSANYEGDQPSEGIDDARRYFGDNISFYIDEGKIKSDPSTLINLDKEGKPVVLRIGLDKRRFS